MTRVDYFEIAKELIRERASAASDLYPKNTELGIAREVVRSLVGHVKSMVELMHQTHRYGDTDGWEVCQESVCSHTAQFLASIGVEL